jgi:hypothetical protein
MKEKRDEVAIDLCIDKVIFLSLLLLLLHGFFWCFFAGVGRDKRSLLSFLADSYMEGAGKNYSSIMIKFSLLSSYSALSSSSFSSPSSSSQC